LRGGAPAAAPSASAGAAGPGAATGPAQASSSAAPSHAAAPAAPLAAAAAAAPAGVQVEYVGRPVAEVVLRLELPGPGPGSDADAAPRVEVAGRSVLVSRPGADGAGAELAVALLFAVSGEGAVAEWRPGEGSAPGRGLLALRLPYRPLRRHLEDARLQAPLALGALGLASGASALELDDL
jgi:hypothetical protein